MLPGSPLPSSNWSVDSTPSATPSFWFSGCRFRMVNQPNRGGCQTFSHPVSLCHWWVPHKKWSSGPKEFHLFVPCYLVGCRLNMVSQPNRGFNSFHHLSPFSALSWPPKLVNRAISVPRILTINLPVEGQPPLRRESIGRGPWRAWRWVTSSKHHSSKKTTPGKGIEPFQ